MNCVLEESSLSGQDNHWHVDRHLRLIVLEVKYHSLRLDQRRQGLDVLHAVVHQLAGLKLGLVEEEDSAVDKRAHESLLHLIGVVVLTRSESGFAQRVDSGIEAAHKWIHSLHELANRRRLLRRDTTEIHIDVSNKEGALTAISSRHQGHQ